MREWETLEAAADIIERDGWYQGELYRGEQHLPFEQQVGYQPAYPTLVEGPERAPVCLVGALYRATTGRADIPNEEARRAEQWLVVALSKREWSGGTSPAELTMWNDTLGRGQQEVLDLLREAAKEARMAEEGV